MWVPLPLSLSRCASADLTGSQLAVKNPGAAGSDLGQLGQ